METILSKETELLNKFSVFQQTFSKSFDLRDQQSLLSKIQDPRSKSSFFKALLKDTALNPLFLSNI
jgi:hypothetical protein